MSFKLILRSDNMENLSLVREGRRRGEGDEISPWLLKKNPLEMEFRIIFTRK